ncbi:hypothetical protein, partial [Klebsiella pneumoniae]|uniref:hypothetical protein n=1 Tax=Klebsiella pneumoniae TaxID=573 RepID=UPI001C630372
EILQFAEHKILANEISTKAIKKTSLSTKFLLLTIIIALISNIIFSIYSDDNPRYKTAKKLYAIDKCQIQAWANMPENVNEIIT